MAIVIAAAIGSAFTENASAASVSGTTRLVGTLTPNMVVRAYRRDNGQLIGQSMSDGSGNYVISTGGYTGLCYVLALDSDDTAPDYQSQIFDRVTPA